MSCRLVGLVVIVLMWMGNLGWSQSSGVSRPQRHFPELESPQFGYRSLEGLGPEQGVTRRDPSDVIRVRGVYYVWYTKVEQGPGVFAYPSGYSGAIWYATSRNGLHWTE
ncbi:MAG: hypothetical protein ACRD19_05630, partial [Terriglobia bacterium]